MYCSHAKAVRCIDIAVDRTRKGGNKIEKYEEDVWGEHGRKLHGGTVPDRNMKARLPSRK